MSRRAASATLVLASMLAPLAAAAQPSGSNLLLAQLGNYPSVPPKDRHDLYDQINLDYGFGIARVGLRYELNRNSEEQFEYEGVTQRWAEWTTGPYRARVGTFETILGRGLIHRSFELPGVVLDQIGIRSRYAFSRDMDGALGELNAGPVNAVVFSGKANAGTNSLAADELGLKRYAGQFEGAQLAGSPVRGGRLGAGYVRSNSAFGPQQELGTGFLDVDPLAILGVPSVSLPIYLEYAQADRSFGDWWSFQRGAQVPHASYGSVGLVWGRLGASAEWKDYAQFRFGTNDPPSLVREQTYALLNRNTHVLDPGRETGYQFEVSYAPREVATITANLSRADGVALNRYREGYVELRVAPPGAGRWEASVFYDEAEDRISALDDGHTVGGASTVRVGEKLSGRVDVERQTAEHPGGPGLPGTPFENFRLAVSAARAEWGSLAVIWERTSDPEVRSVFGRDGTFLHLMAGELSARIAQGHEATLTFGRFRGGRACTAGTCYDVPPFDGGELRLVSRF